MKILNQKISQIVLLQHDQLPFLKLLNTKNVSTLVSKYRFSGFQPVQDTDGNIVGINFGAGLFLTDQKTELAIARLAIEARRIIIEVEGTSADAVAFFRELRTFLAELAASNDENFLKPILVAEESEITASLNFPADKLISPNFYNFVQANVIAQGSNELAKASLGSITTSFQIDYTPNDDSLSKRRITLNRKDFLLQSAIGHPLSDRVFQSKAPFDTKTHIELLSDIEKSI